MFWVCQLQCIWENDKPEPEGQTSDSLYLHLWLGGATRQSFDACQYITLALSAIAPVWTVRPVSLLFKLAWLVLSVAMVYNGFAHCAVIGDNPYDKWHNQDRTGRRHTSHSL